MNYLITLFIYLFNGKSTFDGLFNDKIWIIFKIGFIYIFITNITTRVHMLNGVVWISHSDNTLWKGMNPIIITSATDT